MGYNSTISIYACGGAGINICKKFEGEETQPGFAGIIPFYIDTSKSNIDLNLPEDNVYHIKNLDGSGKYRRENHTAIADCVKDILLKHKPGDYSIIVSSTSGGSGNIIAGTLLNELIKRGSIVIILAVGSRSSRIEIDNTIKTIKSYAAISKNNNAPVALYYAENKRGEKWAVVDEDFRTTIKQLACLFSGDNDGQDFADMRSWVYYNRVTTHEPGLVFLNIDEGEVNVADEGVIISIATLANHGDDTYPGLLADYQSTGFIKEGSGFHLDAPIHFTLCMGVFEHIIDDLNSTIAKFDETKSASVKCANILSDNDSSTDSGIVF